MAFLNHPDIVFDYPYYLQVVFPSLCRRHIEEEGWTFLSLYERDLTFNYRGESRMTFRRRNLFLTFHPESCWVIIEKKSRGKKAILYSGQCWDRDSFKYRNSELSKIDKVVSKKSP